MGFEWGAIFKLLLLAIGARPLSHDGHWLENITRSGVQHWLFLATVVLLITSLAGAPVRRSGLSAWGQ